MSWIALLTVLLLAVSAWSAMRGFLVQQVEAEERIPWTSTRHAVLARETLARALFRLLAPVGWFEAPLPQRPGTDGHPVLLVPDPHVGRAGFAFLHVFLRHRGFAVWPIRLPDLDQPLAERAEHLEAHVDRLCEATGAEQIDLVAFGAGGLAAAWSLTHGEAASKVRRLVTLGTPWHGTRLALFLPGALAVECRVGAHGLEGLTPCPVPNLSIWCPEDPEVVPADSARADVERSVAIEGAGHRGLLLSARAFRAVLSGLTEPLPEPALLPEDAR